jgi:hypothetical protein
VSSSSHLRVARNPGPPPSGSTIVLRFSVVHTFDAPPRAVADAMLHPEMPAFLGAHHPMMEAAVPQTREEHGTVVRRTIRYRPRPVVRRVGMREIPPDSLAFVEESSFDRAALRGEFKNSAVRASVARHFVNEGTMTLRAIDGGRTERTIDAYVQIIGVSWIRPLRMIAERVIRTQTLKLLEGEAVCVREFLRARR